MKIFAWVGACFVFCVVPIGVSYLGATPDDDNFNESWIIGLSVCIFILACIIATIIVFPESFGYMRIVVEEAG